MSTAELPEAVLSSLEAAGCAATVQPFIHTEAAVTDLVRGHILRLAQQKITVAFTSAPAVAAVTAHLSAIPDWTIYAVSGTTLCAVTEFFGAERIAGHAVNGQLIAEQVIAARIPELLFFCGNRRMDILPETLQKAGIPVKELIVYTTTTTPVTLTEAYDGILFFSPSAAESFFSQNTLTQHVTLFAIGNTTAAALRTYSANKIVTAAFPSKESVAASVMQHFK